MIVQASVKGFYVEFDLNEIQLIAILAAGNGVPPRKIVEIIIRSGLTVTDGQAIKQALK